MKPPEYYQGREQTYLKHFFLEKYLEKVAYIVLSFRKDFVYVDGFSGPWKSEDEDFEDTSFKIAVNQLREVREALNKRGIRSQIRCLFNDNDRAAFRDLETAIKNIDDIKIHAINKNFEDVIPDIIKYIGRSFSLTFIDPTGWKGFSLQKIKPVLNLRGEVIINFMFDYVNRFLEDPRPEIAATFDPLFGGPSWHREVIDRVQAGESREDAILSVYRNRIRHFGGFKHVTSTRILKPLSDRSYFHLVYATRHWKGLVEFRKVEKFVIDEQERVRDVAGYTERTQRTGQPELFAPGETHVGPANYEQEREKNRQAGHELLLRTIKQVGAIPYEGLLGKVLEIPLVWESDVKDWLRELRRNGEIEIPELTGRAHTPKPGHNILWKNAER